MGKEIESAEFDSAAHAEFVRRLARETATALRWGRDGRFAREHPRIGFEVEACLVDNSYHAAPINEKFLRLLGDPHATVELARFNVEFNPPPFRLEGGVLDRARETLTDIFLRAGVTAEHLDTRLLLTGILPTLTPGDLDSRLLSTSNRYQAFQELFARWQGGGMARVEIPENEGLVVGVNSVMMESVTTSQQIHLQVPEPGSGPYYNAAQAVAGPAVALCANSPYFMGRDLWTESRIPVFEQVLMPRFHGGRRREDFFGARHVDHSALEVFQRNLDRLAVILPEVSEADGTLPHLALHNSTAWRWNRPVIAFEEDGRPTLRIEFRAAPSGPTIGDMVANAAFFVGAVWGLANGELAGLSGRQLQRRLPFATVRENFYACARDGLDAEVGWLGGVRRPVGELICDTLLPVARDALTGLGVDADAVGRALGIAERRAETRRNGATWQRAHMRRTDGGSLGVAKMVASYYRRQNQDIPVHEWSV